MPAHVIVGAQWGDEGKGRVADWFAKDADIVARYAGGDNAGHTVRVGNDTFKLHLVPSGVLYGSTINIMGNGMVVNPLKLVDELRGLDERGIDIDPVRIRLSRRAHLITPAHIALDGAREAQRGSGKIGTPKRGIGPAYTDKAARSGLRTGLMEHPERFAPALREHFNRKNRQLEALYNAEPIAVDQSIDVLVEAADYLAPFLADVDFELYEALRAGKSVLCEGAQGTLLDIDHGNYPYVTSSSATAGGALTGLGIGPRWVDRITGVTKAYTTRVGAGPFPTELDDERGDRLRGTGANPWDEYGTTTGRPRRCGWLDAVVLRYAARINGLTDLVVTKLDILSGFDEIEIADEYTHHGEPLAVFPSEADTLDRVEPITLSMPGWQEDIMSVTTLADLPQAARDYIDKIADLSGVPVSLATVGPARHQSIPIAD
ncbi:MAG: adenylosuccinate synthase [Anaerolineae bacterium]